MGRRLKKDGEGRELCPYELLLLLAVREKKKNETHCCFPKSMYMPVFVDFGMPAIL